MPEGIGDRVTGPWPGPSSETACAALFRGGTLSPRMPPPADSFAPMSARPVPVLALRLPGSATPQFLHLYNGVTTAPTWHGRADRIGALVRAEREARAQRGPAARPVSAKGRGRGRDRRGLFRSEGARPRGRRPQTRPTHPGTRLGPRVGALLPRAVGPGTPSSRPTPAAPGLSGPYLSTVPLAWARNRCWRRAWNWGSREASRQLGFLSEVSHSGLSDAAGDSL